mmetsp:Transcript_9129/g.12617  ORF Transcript_9129/g.12617 Transcript_9129/m.12617 type:complete len:202 (+) Transcript_9129:742-1347(+)
MGAGGQRLGRAGRQTLHDDDGGRAAVHGPAGGSHRASGPGAAEAVAAVRRLRPTSQERRHERVGPPGVAHSREAAVRPPLPTHRHPDGGPRGGRRRHRLRLPRPQEAAGADAGALPARGVPLPAAASQLHWTPQGVRARQSGESARQCGVSAGAGQEATLPQRTSVSAHGVQLRGRADHPGGAAGGIGDVLSRLGLKEKKN